MAKAKKVKKDELELINKQQKQMNELLRGLGVLDVQKMNMHTQINGLSAAIETTKKDLEEAQLDAIMKYETIRKQRKKEKQEKQNKYYDTL